jgi:hypothetical protein
MKKRMIRAIVLFIVTLIALLIFIGLYIDEKQRVQETYRTQFITHLNQTSGAISSYLDAEGDLPLRYRRILGNFSGADSFAFVMTGLTDDQKRAVNEVYSCLLKYPEQMQEKERLEALQTAVDDMSQNLDKGFEEAAALVDSIDKKGL